jgi:hypothetical protein
MPALISKRRVDEFRRAFDREINSLAALYRNAAADALDVLSQAAATVASRQRALALLRQYQYVLAGLNDEAALWIQLNVPKAYQLGVEFGEQGLRGVRRAAGRAGINLRPEARRAVALRERDVFSRVHQEAVQAITGAMLDQVNAAVLEIGRRTDDVFRQQGILAVARGVAAGKARVEVSREIKDRLIAAGQPVFRDRLNRVWTLDRYAEMVARTTTREAMTQGTINRLREEGIVLAQVSQHPCKDFCVYYENVIVCIQGTHPVYPGIEAIGGGPPFHPRCIHVLRPFVERLASREEKQEGKVAADLLRPEGKSKEQHFALLQRRFTKEFPQLAREEGKRLRAEGARAEARRERAIARAGAKSS